MPNLARKIPAGAAPARKQSTTRLEARIPSALKEIIEEASNLTGHSSVTSYIVQTLQESASRAVQESRLSRLAAAESAEFVQALLTPSAPAQTLQSAFARYRDQVR
ncbi:MAG: DUF1778 domain-containing protein [Opitutaceae bacterium]|jgi:uncharacterized protein (DUF1778 family)